MRNIFGWIFRRRAQPLVIGESLIAAAQCHYAARAFERAADLCRTGLSESPETGALWQLLGASQLRLGKAAMASESFARAAALQPLNPDAHSNLAEALRQAGRPDKAVEACGLALAIQADHVPSMHNLALALQPLGRIDEGVALLRRAIELQPRAAAVHSALLFLLNRHADSEPAAIAAEHVLWAARFADPLTVLSDPHNNDPDPDRVLRVGYVSGDLFRHAVSYFIEPVLAAHNPDAVETHCYYTGQVKDEVTSRLRGIAGHWHSVAPLDDEALSAKIRRNGIDILVDLSGHTRDNRLLTFARKPAPVQLTWLGYLNTTGMSAMDYRLTDGISDPSGAADSLHREELLRLSRCQWCYAPPRDAPPVSAAPEAEAGAVIFGAFNQFNKLNPRCVRLWSRVLAALPAATLKIHGLPVADSGDYILDIFEEHGIDLGRISLTGTLDFDAYLRAYAKVHVVLDTLPYNGGTTTCESMWMGVPVVTRAGVAGAQRSGASLLSAAGLQHLIAESDDEYVAIAISLARNPEKLAVLRDTLREQVQRSPLMDTAGFVRELEATYRRAWRRWCGQARGDRTLSGQSGEAGSA
ncbi:MAG: tetratricopeptide repeat protein [Betaproteobacteria bacterium]|nr:tetratricopeptide repeat protein [Betaproteobacteria bacterium]